MRGEAMFDIKSVEKAVRYLADTDESCAMAKARMLAGKEHIKTTLATCFLDAPGSSVKERESEAMASEAYRKVVDDYADAVADYETQKNKRLRAELTIEVWRSVNSAKAKGVI